MNGNTSKEMSVEEIAVHMVVPDKIIEAIVYDLRMKFPYNDDLSKEVAEMEADYKLIAAKALHSKLYGST